MDVAGPQPGDDGFKDWPAMYGGAEGLEQAAIEASPPTVTRLITPNVAIAVDLYPQQILTLLKTEAEAVIGLLRKHDASILGLPVHKADVLIALGEMRRLAMKLPTGALPQ